MSGERLKPNLQGCDLLLEKLNLDKMTYKYLCYHWVAKKKEQDVSC